MVVDVINVNGMTILETEGYSPIARHPNGIEAPKPSSKWHAAGIPVYPYRGASDFGQAWQTVEQQAAGQVLASTCIRTPTQVWYPPEKLLRQLPEQAQRHRV